MAYIQHPPNMDKIAQKIVSKILLNIPCYFYIPFGNSQRVIHLC